MRTSIRRPESALIGKLLIGIGVCLPFAYAAFLRLVSAFEVGRRYMSAHHFDRPVMLGVLLVTTVTAVAGTVTLFRSPIRRGGTSLLDVTFYIAGFCVGFLCIVCCLEIAGDVFARIFSFAV
jgi:hypothetical protein